MIFLRFLQRFFPEVFVQDKDADTSRRPERARRNKKRRRVPEERDETTEGEREPDVEEKEIPQRTQKVRESQVSTLKTPGGGNEKRRK